MRRFSKFQFNLIAAGAASLALCLFAENSAADGHAFTISGDDPSLEWGPCPDFFPAGCELAVLHGDASKPNSDVFFKTPGNYDLPKHWHSSAERMILVAGEMQLNYEGQEPVMIKQGNYIFGPPKLPHDGRCVSADPCILFIAFEGPIDAHQTQ